MFADFKQHPKITKNLIWLIKLSLVFLVFWFLLHSAQFDVHLFFNLIHYPLSFLPVMGLFLGLVIINAWRWYRLNYALNVELTYLNAILPTYLGLAFNNVLPSGMGGDFVRLFYLIKKQPQYKSKVIISALFDRLAGLMGIFFIIAIIAAYYYSVFRENESLYYVFIVCDVVCLLGIIFFMATLFMPEKTGFTHWLTKSYPERKIFHQITKTLAAIRTFRQSKLIIIESILVSMLSQALLTIVLLVIIHLMGSPNVSFLTIAIALAIAQIVNLLPLTPGGLGFGEAAFANVILLIEPSAVFAYATVFFAFRFLLTLTYLPGVLVGIFGFDKTFIRHSR